jgi:Flp pilus assembly protein TadD
MRTLMAIRHLSRTRVAALILSFVGLALAATSVRADAQVVAAASESPSDALSRHLRVLAGTPRNFQALVGAGRAALELGDTQAAAGFFGRAEEVWPTSPMPHIGMGAATALDGDAQGALVHFGRASQLGAGPTAMGADRGLAFDLLGRHSEAQADYRAAFAGPEADEARRRLALSLAITGDKPGALNALSPLLQRRDPAAIRSRALVLALTGDQAGAREAIEWTLPGGWAQMGPFLGRLATLNSAEKAAAVNLGIFPGSGQAVATVQGDRLSDIDRLLGRAAPSATPQLPVQPPAAQLPQPQIQRPPPAQVQSAPMAAVTTSTAVPVAPSPRRHWVQLASGPNANALPEQLRRSRSRADDLLDGISGYVAEDPGRARLLIGPFRNEDEAQIFADDLESVGVRAFRWTNPQGQLIRKIPNE